MGSYRERLTVPVSYWLLAVPIAFLLGGEAYFFVDGVIPIVVIALIGLVEAAFLVNWGAATIEVTGGVLRAGGDTLALSEAGQVVSLDERQTKLLGGPRADPAARILLRPYLRRAVYVELADASEKAPYLLVATRRPDELAEVIERSRQTDERESVG